MVQLFRSGLRSDSKTTTARDKFPARFVDSLIEEYGQPNKRSKSSTPSNEWSTGSNEFPIPPSQYNPLDEPSPLGLRLRKSPSLLDLIQMKLSQGNASSLGSAPSGNRNLRDDKDANGTTASAITDRLKASNFPALHLRIGQWEYVSRHEVDLVAKCYFSKHKLVWEILEGGLKSKIEIQWSDIMALKANCPDDGPGTLTVTLARPPRFYKETNPQPRKHTSWQATADFTDGQASIHRQHFLQCSQGHLNKHYEKLIQCDMRLNLVSQQPETVLDSPYFEEQSFVFKDPKVRKVDHLETAKISSISGFQDVASPSTSQSCSLKIDEHNFGGIKSEYLSPEESSPSSGNASHGGERQDWEQLKVPGLHPSMSMSDLVNHIGHCISEKMASGNSTCSKEALDRQDMLDNIAQILLGDTQFSTASDEKQLMSRVNSLCCLLQDPAIAPNAQADGKSQFEELDDRKHIQTSIASYSMHENMTVGDFGFPGQYSKDDVPSCKQAPTMPRKDSFADLLLSLPRIASLPRMASLSNFLFEIQEDSEDQPR